MLMQEYVQYNDNNKCQLKYLTVDAKKISHNMYMQVYITV